MSWSAWVMRKAMARTRRTRRKSKSTNGDRAAPTPPQIIGALEATQVPFGAVEGEREIWSTELTREQLVIKRGRLVGSRLTVQQFRGLAQAFRRSRRMLRSKRWGGITWGPSRLTEHGATFNLALVPPSGLQDGPQVRINAVLKRLPEN